MKCSDAVTANTKEKFIRKPKTFVFRTVKIQWVINQSTELESTEKLRNKLFVSK